MGAQSSKDAQLTPATVIDEKASLFARDELIETGIGGPTDLTSESLDKWASDFNENPTLLLSRLVLSNADPLLSLAKRSALVHDAKVFNLDLKGVNDKNDYPGPRTNQASSGRCWIFATTVDDCRNVLDLVDEPLDGRLISFLNEAPVNDGGQWDMAVNIIEKYGIVPSALFPESFSSAASSRLNSLLTSKLREYSLRLRKASSSASIAALRNLKATFLAEVYSTLAIALGTPPKPDEKLKWDYYDKDNKFHSWEGTPRQFYSSFGKRKGMDPKDSFSLINDPRNAYETLYTVERLGNVWGGRPVQYVNAPITALEDAVIAGIRANTPLFFGCDVGKASNSKEGVMDRDLYDLKAAYGYELGMNKAQRLETGESSMTHAMVITAVHLDDKGRPVRYKVENSWSDSAGEKGWFMMTAPWFREYVYQVVVPRSIVDKKWGEVLDGGRAVVLKPWDPMVSSVKRVAECALTRHAIGYPGLKAS
ncbi:bleomycin hydrolase, partial [Tremellales sp. Uapishka_1]